MGLNYVPVLAPQTIVASGAQSPLRHFARVGEEPGRERTNAGDPSVRVLLATGTVVDCLGGAGKECNESNENEDGLDHHHTIVDSVIFVV